MISTCFRNRRCENQVIHLRVGAWAGPEWASGPRSPNSHASPSFCLLLPPEWPRDMCPRRGQASARGLCGTDRVVCNEAAEAVPVTTSVMGVDVVPAHRGVFCRAWLSADMRGA